MRPEPLRTNLCRAIEEHKHRLVELCSEVIGVPSENPPGDTSRLAQYLTKWARGYGIEFDVYEPKRGVFDLMSTIGRGSPHLVLSGHLDTFPAGEGWTFNPFSGQVSGGKILGRGACDMKAGLCASLFAFLMIKEELAKGGLGRLPGKLSLCLVSDEESGGEWGTNWSLENTAIAEADACLIGEPGGLDVVGIGEKGTNWFRLTVTGRAAHGAYDILGENAITKMCEAIHVVESLRTISAEPPEELGEIIGQERPYIESNYGRGTGEVLTRVSVNVGKIGGGLKLNLIPDRCEVEVDTRLPIGVTAASVTDALVKGLRCAGIDSYALEPISRSEATYTSPEEAITRVVCRNVEYVTMQPPRQLIKIGATDSRFFRLAGIPTVTYGPGFHNMGAPDEFIRVEELVTVAKAHVCSAVDYLLEE